MSRRMIVLWTVVGFLLAILAVTLPVLRSVGRARENEKILEQLAQRMEDMGAAAGHRQRSLAKWYNRNLTLKTPEEGFQGAYESLLSFGDGVMGYIAVPEIGLQVPIYHGTGSEILAKGAGHVSESALPVGGRGNHTVLMGSGMFKKSYTLAKGTAVYIGCLGETLVYTVEDVQVMPQGWPVDTVSREGEDLLTLVTDQASVLGVQRVIVRCSRSGAISAQARVMEAEDRETVEAAIAVAIGTCLLPLFLCCAGKGLRQMRIRSAEENCGEKNL